LECVRGMLVLHPGVATRHGPWDGLPITMSAFVASGVDVLLGQATAGGIGLIIFWRRWRAAMRLWVPKEVGAC